MIYDYELPDIVEEAEQRGYNKAIDDCKELTFREVVYYDSLNDRTEFRELAEQLKEKYNEQRSYVNGKNES